MSKVITIIVLCLVPIKVFCENLPLVCHEFLPYNYKGDDGSVAGSSTEIITAVLKRMGYEADIKLLPWNRAYRIAANGEAAMLFTFSRSPERENDFFFTDSLATIEVVFFKRKSDNITWSILTDLEDYRMGYVSGYNYGSTMMEAISSNIFKKTDMIAASETADYQQLMKLVNNRIDLAVCPKTQCSKIIESNSPKFDKADYIDKPIGAPRDFYGGFSKKWPDAEKLRDRFNKEYQKFVDEGKRKLIFRKYGITE